MGKERMKGKGREKEEVKGKERVKGNCMKRREMKEEK